MKRFALWATFWVSLSVTLIFLATAVSLMASGEVGAGVFAIALVAPVAALGVWVLPRARRRPADPPRTSAGPLADSRPLLPDVQDVLHCLPPSPLPNARKPAAPDSTRAAQTAPMTTALPTSPGPLDPSIRSAAPAVPPPPPDESRPSGTLSPSETLPTQLAPHPTHSVEDPANTVLAAASALAGAAAKAAQTVHRGRSGLQRVSLTREIRGRPAVDETFVALDLETTGLDSARDFAIEVGAVRFRGDGTVLDEFATLVAGPPTSAEAWECHRIDDDERADAPPQEEVWRELFAFLRGSVVVCHNADFEQGFLEAAARRHRLHIPDLPIVCTLVDSRRHFDGRAFSLKSLHRHATGAWRDDTHQALGDARATMEVLLWMTGTSPTPLRVTGHPPTLEGDPYSEGCAIRCRPAPLQGASVASVLASLPRSRVQRQGDPHEVDAYVQLLHQVMDDGRLTYDEAQALARQAVRTGLGGPQLAAMHQVAFEEAFGDVGAEAPPVSQLRQMATAAAALGLDDLADELRARLPVSGAVEAEPPRFLRGRRFAFCGDSTELLALRAKALAHGAPEVKNITKTVVWVAADEVDGTSRQHGKARELGLPILAIREADVRLSEEIAIAQHEQFEREQVLAAQEAERARWRAERERQQEADDAYWGPTWRKREHKEDPGPPEW